ncbi:acetyl-CoA carboxylase carboxyltransferase subunit beta [Anaerosacchariphilus polymeriproducens]|uniref:Multifunctional fusion protein n=2 Tax=Anaerosacchariphilus polymeriproducens TaxID=1812858 RepID=A0A371AUS1_9FIRM|nr:acetyl-CoA carboxylase carboxyltransferase subunit alpha [Anaerosacchariphilus polymeriproducens]RDU23323.1 acetyl-CoA carboxylase carboxyltransferase subunit beta [Anaerosacchariphilus polymeriproducens]
MAQNDSSKVGKVLKRGKGKEEQPQVPEGLWIKCDKCGELLYKEDVKNNNYSCYKCGKYFRLNTRRRIRMVADANSFEIWDIDLENKNPLDFPNYEEQIKAVKEKTKLDEAVTTGKAKIHGEDVVIGICDARFLMGSMGQVVGEKIARAVERATKERLPVVIFTCSGGARMQEGMVSLMQMAKTSAALKRHSDAGLLYISVLTDPTTGGVTASFAMLGDIILAEPGALVGFAGARVIEQTIGQKLPEGFQRAEFLLEHGLIDKIVEREDLKDTLHKLIVMHKIDENVSWNISNTEKSLFRAFQEDNSDNDITAWERVQTARMASRPTALDYANEIFTDFIELHGDRAFRDDSAIIAGIAMLDGNPVTVIGQQKGRNTKENILRNFGMPYPEGYRKALRFMKQAEKFNRPIINFIDTPGAFCGVEAEERGQGEAIARNLMEMAGIKVPILSIVIGEGGSGGALALGVGNEVWMLENTIYAVLSPEGFASILWKDGKRADEAADVMKITAADLKRLGIIEKIIPEKEPVCEANLAVISDYIRFEMRCFLQKLTTMTPEQIVNHRYDRFRRI